MPLQLIKLFFFTNPESSDTLGLKLSPRPQKNFRSNSRYKIENGAEAKGQLITELKPEIVALQYFRDDSAHGMKSFTVWIAENYFDVLTFAILLVKQKYHQ